MKLDMHHFLAVVAEYGALQAREALLAEGYHPKVILRKAEKAADKGYTEYGVSVDRCWLRAEGVTHLKELNARQEKP